jgi:glucose-1-phosphate thymidylyltransferase
LIDRLASDGGSVALHTAHECWEYGGKLDVLLEANRLALDGIERDVGPRHLNGAQLQGRVCIHPTATVENATIRGPAVIGPGAIVRDAFVGPYTSIGAHAEIDGAEIEHSIVLPGASICFVGRRIEASVVGADARVTRDFTLPRAMRLRLGDSAEISLS